MEESRLKNIPSECVAPPNIFPGLVPSMGRTREQHNSHKGGTREKHNSYKWQNVETKRRPTITKQTPRSGDQTLKLHHVRTPTLSKRGKRWRAEYNTDLQRKAVVYKETWNAWESTQYVLILHGFTLKPRALSQGKEDERAT